MSVRKTAAEYGHDWLEQQIARIANKAGWHLAETVQNLTACIDGFDGLPITNQDFVACLETLVE